MTKARRWIGIALARWVPETTRADTPRDREVVVRHPIQLVAWLLLLSACTATPIREPPGFGRVDEEGTVQWASLEPGSYATTRFQPRLSFVVGGGWSGVDSDFAMVLTRDNGTFTSFFLNRYAGRAAVRCSRTEEMEELEGLNELVAWILVYEGLNVIEGEPMTVGGYPARVLDIALAEGQLCPGDEVVDGVAHSFTMLWASERLRTRERLHAVFIDHPDRPLILTLNTLPAEFAPPGPPGNIVTLEDFIELARPVIESIEFEPPAT